MKAFHNRSLLIYKKISFWNEFGFQLKTDDGRLILIKPLKSSFDTEFRGMIVFYSAEIDLQHLPKISPDGSISFPKLESTLLRQAFIFYANLISVAEVCRVEASAPTPSRGFIPENDADRAHLNKSEGFADYLIVRHVFGGNYGGALVKDQLLDRSEGLAFLAAANALQDNVAKLHEFVRVFERAFAASSNELAQLLFQFLSQYKHFDYTEDEISSWIVEKRDAATHADRRNSHVFSSDLIDDITRIHQAAYDVLFNKVKWHDKDVTRCSLLEFDTIYGKDNALTLIRNKEVEVHATSFFRLEHGEIDFYCSPPKLPSEWWTKRVQRTSQF
jgi:hypothetical protein